LTIQTEGGEYVEAVAQNVFTFSDAFVYGNMEQQIAAMEFSELYTGMDLRESSDSYLQKYYKIVDTEDSGTQAVVSISIFSGCFSLLMKHGTVSFNIVST